MHAQSPPRSLRAATKLLLAAAPFAVASAGSAQDVQNAQEPVAAQELPDITVLIGRTRLIQAPWPARGAAITDPRVADIQVLTPELVLVSGTGVGASDLVLWGDDGRHASGRVEVQADLPRLAEQLAIVAPGAALALSQSGDVLVVSGPLGTAEDALVLRRYLDTLGLAYVDATRLPGAAQVHVNVPRSAAQRCARSVSTVS
jgi:Flp pilus assembly secretin CpaC